jgi:Rieske Fe-S protein
MIDSEPGVTTISDTGRRRFLSRIIAAIQTVMGASLCAVAGSTVLSPSLERRNGSWRAAASLLDLLDDEPTPVTLRVAREDGYNDIVDRHTVFLVKTGDDTVAALSSTCTHLGCRVSWDATDKVLKCPCHGGVFSLTGAVVSGPAPAPLVTIPTRVVDGEQIMVQL